MRSTHGPYPSAYYVMPGGKQPLVVGYMVMSRPPPPWHTMHGALRTRSPPISSQASPSRQGPQGQHTPLLGGQHGVRVGVARPTMVPSGPQAVGHSLISGTTAFQPGLQALNPKAC